MPKDVPKQEHYAILTFGLITEDSGYPDDRHNYRTITNYHVYTDIEKWTKQITALQINQEKYIALICRQAEITTEVNVKIK